eukprot:m.19931 g.19931  ORF g.19931 m.19931 type:complete len:928 (+) comp27927_c0_seq2:43-2826(+)
MQIPIEWKQTEDVITVSLLIGECKLSEIEAEWSDEDCIVQLQDGRSWQCKWHAPVNSQQSSMKKTPSHLKLQLVKKEPGLTWPYFQAHEESKSEVVPLPYLQNDWRDWGDCVSLTLHVFNVNPTTLQKDFATDAIYLKFQTEDILLTAGYPEANFFFWAIKLSHLLDVEKSRCYVTETAIELDIVKTNANEAWPKPFTLLSKDETNDAFFDLEMETAISQSRLEEERKKHEWMKKKEQELDESMINLAKSVSELDQIEISGSPGPTDRPTILRLRSQEDGTIDSPAALHLRAFPLGIQNLGCTCFLSSIVQCLAHCAELRTYILDGHFFPDINVKNPLGCKGELVKAFAFTLRKMWGAEFKKESVSPKSLLKVFKAHVDHFADYSQQDAQEFMSFLLDGLHEDLNRVKEKPRTSPIEAKGRPDFEVAEEAWKTHGLRNDSFISDLFGGQFKSTVTCKTCGNMSTTFDPFLHMSVPLPKEEMPMQVIYMTADPDEKFHSLVLRLPTDADSNDLYAAVLKRQHDLNISQEGNEFIAYEVLNGVMITAILPQYNRSLKSIQVEDRFVVAETPRRTPMGELTISIIIYQRRAYPPMPKKCSKCWKKGIPLKRCSKCFQVAYCGQSCQKAHWSGGQHNKKCGKTFRYIGLPFILSVSRSEATYSRLSHLAQAHAKRSVDVRCGDDVKNKNKVEFYLISVKGSSLEEGKIDDLGDKPIVMKDFTFLAMEWQNPKEEENKSLVVEERTDNMYGIDETAYPQNKNALRLGRYSVTLKQCFDLFTKQEELDEADTCYCSKCKTHREASKKLSIWRLPHVLVIQLKRFSYTGNILRDKLFTKVTFPIRDLDIGPYLADSGTPEKNRNCHYELFGVAYHLGLTFGGHYTAVARLSGDWYQFDDDRVLKLSKMDEEKIVTSQAYVLFYRRKERFDAEWN